MKKQRNSDNQRTKTRRTVMFSLSSRNLDRDSIFLKGADQGNLWNPLMRNKLKASGKVSHQD